MHIEDNQHIEDGCMTDGYTVESYTELDFENVTLDTSEQGTIETCTHCDADNWVLYSGIYSCDECGSINHKDIEV